MFKNKQRIQELANELNDLLQEERLIKNKDFYVPTFIYNAVRSLAQELDFYDECVESGEDYYMCKRHWE